MKIYLEERHWKIVRDILSKYPYTFYAFGSRAKGRQRKFSDLDLCSTDHIPLNVYGQIEEDFEESDLPFKVDIVLWSNMTPKFQTIIQEDLVLIQEVQKPN